jgi:hypothetical protein
MKDGLGSIRTVTTKRPKPRPDEAADGATNCESAHPTKPSACHGIESHRIDVANRVAPDVRIRNDPASELDGIGLGVDPTRREFTVPRGWPWARVHENGRVEEDASP